LQEATARFRAQLRLAEGKGALARNNITAAIDGLSDANSYFHSRKIALALALMRLSPKLLQSLLHLRNKVAPRAAARI
jgi:hypothetical protein